MYKIEKKLYGYKLTFSDFIQADEMQLWVDESERVLKSAPNEFGVFVDMRTLKPLPADSRLLMQKGQKLFKQKGMVRSVVILDDTITKIQFQRIGRETGIYKWERYIDASATANWEKTGIDWIDKAIDPDN
jgi:hypothetical protein